MQPSALATIVNFSNSIILNYVKPYKGYMWILKKCTLRKIMSTN